MVNAPDVAVLISSVFIYYVVYVVPDEHHFVVYVVSDALHFIVSVLM